MAKNEWIDISVPIREGMVHWPGDPVVCIRSYRSIHKGDSCNVSQLSFCSHTGTHIDAPRHFFDRAQGIDKLALEVLIGPSRVIVIRNTQSITKAELKQCAIRPGERILFKTRNSRKRWVNRRFDKNFVYLAQDAAQFLAGKKIGLLGIDYLSVGASSCGGADVHRILLEAGIAVIEGLDLSAVEPGKYDLVCLPLRIADADGAPVRAALHRR